MNYSLGYARVSTHAQYPQLQLDALTAAGVDRVYVDHIRQNRALALQACRSRR